MRIAEIRGKGKNVGKPQGLKEKKQMKMWLERKEARKSERRRRAGETKRSLEISRVVKCPTSLPFEGMSKTVICLKDLSSPRTQLHL